MWPFQRLFWQNMKAQKNNILSKVNGQIVVYAYFDDGRLTSDVFGPLCSAFWTATKAVTSNWGIRPDHLMPNLSSSMQSTIYSVIVVILLKGPWYNTMVLMGQNARQHTRNLRCHGSAIGGQTYGLISHVESPVCSRWEVRMKCESRRTKSRRNKWSRTKSEVNE